MTNLVDGSLLGHSQLSLLVKGLFLEKVADLVTRVEKVVVANMLLVLMEWPLML